MSPFLVGDVVRVKKTKQYHYNCSENWLWDVVGVSWTGRLRIAFEGRYADGRRETRQKVVVEARSQDLRLVTPVEERVAEAVMGGGE